MTVAELIKKLKDTKKKYGNLEITDDIYFSYYVPEENGEPKSLKIIAEKSTEKTQEIKPKTKWEKLHRKIFKGLYCDECGGRLRQNGMYGLGAHADHTIYKCEECGKEYITI